MTEMNFQTHSSVQAQQYSYSTI
ncbi:hypothetical protein [Clostridium sp. MCC353]